MTAITAQSKAAAISRLPNSQLIDLTVVTINEETWTRSLNRSRYV
jgi:hypothetical protein